MKKALRGGTNAARWL